MPVCKHPSCVFVAKSRRESIFALCQRHIDELSIYVNRKPVWGTDLTRPSGIRYRGALRRFGWGA